MDLRIEGLAVRYGQQPVLHDLSLRVEAGQFVALVGPNGSGKSTLVRAISGTVPVSAGRIEAGALRAATSRGAKTASSSDVADLRRMGAAERARLIAVLAQETKVDFDFSAEEVVGMGRLPYVGRFQRETAQDWAVVRQAMHDTCTAHLAARPITTLSGGERQRVLFARALAQEPKLLLLDEPTAHLDMAHSVELLTLVRRRNQAEGLTVLAVLHDLNLAAQVADRIVVLNKGAIVADGAPEAVIEPDLIGRVWGAAVQVVPHPVSGVPQVLLLGSLVGGAV